MVLQRDLVSSRSIDSLRVRILRLRALFALDRVVRIDLLGSLWSHSLLGWMLDVEQANLCSYPPIVFREASLGKSGHADFLDSSILRLLADTQLLTVLSGKVGNTWCAGRPT